MDANEIRRLRAEVDYYEREAETLEAAAPGLEAKLDRAKASTELVRDELTQHHEQIFELRAKAAEARTNADAAEAEFGGVGGGGSAGQPTVRTENG